MDYGLFSGGTNGTQSLYDHLSIAKRVGEIRPEFQCSFIITYCLLIMSCRNVYPTSAV